MSGENSIVRFNGKNYASWEFQFRMFVKGKELWGHLDGSSKAPTDPKELSSWESKDAKIASWLLSSVEPHMVNNLRGFTTVKAMWDYLRQIYYQDNSARKFQLELDIGNYRQGNLSIEQFYSGFINLWSDYSGLVHSQVPKEALAALQAVHSESQRDQFLMKLRPEFESARAGLINRTPVPSLEVCLGELLREEQRLASQLGLDQDAGGSKMVNMAYAAQGRGRSRSPPQCYSCKEIGHIAKYCSKKFCNYCKKEGHILKDCRVRPQNRSAPAFHTAVQSAFVPISSTSPAVPSSSSNITPEQVQQMIISALSALGLQGKTHLLTSPWLIDSAASNHMTGSSAALQDVRKYDGQQHIQIADGSTLPITAVGNLGSSFTNVFVSPDLSANLISVGQLVEDNCSIHFDRSGCRVQDQASGQEIAKGPKMGRLFPLQSFSIPRSISVGCSAIANNNSHVWHKKLGHPNSVILTHLMKHGYLNNTNEFSSLSFDCAPCKLGKSKSLPFPLQGSRASTCFEIIHSDVWGMSPVISHAQYRYFVTFIDDYSRFTWVYFLRSKADVFSTFKTFVAYVETQFSTCIKIFRSDSGGEYMSHAFQSFLQQKGILSQRSCPYTPQQNGVAERKNRHLLDVVRTLMLESSVPPRFWVEALSTTVYLINHLPSPTLQLDSPYSRLFGVPSEYNSLHVFGCVCFVHLPPIERHKLAAQSVQCAFLGYSNSHKGFVCYDADANKLRISRNVIFFNINISLCLVLILFLLLFHFLLLMMCLVLLVLSPVLCISDVAHCLFLPLNRHLILSCMSHAGLLGFPGPQIGMVFLLPLFRLLFILLLCLSLILRLLLKSVGAKL